MPYKQWCGWAKPIYRMGDVYPLKGNYLLQLYLIYRQWIYWYFPPQSVPSWYVSCVLLWAHPLLWCWCVCLVILVSSSEAILLSGCDFWPGGGLCGNWSALMEYWSVSDPTWPDLTRPDLTWPDLIWHDLVVWMGIFYVILVWRWWWIIL